MDRGPRGEDDALPPTPEPVNFTEPPVQLTERQLDERTTVLAVSGEIPGGPARGFSRRLNAPIAEGRTAVVLDLTEVEFIASRGLSVLLNALRRVTRRGGRMALVCTNPTVLRLFEITRLDSTFDIQPNVDAAIERVRSAS